jgi:tetratricopeptide (TPR) repeat protein
LSQRTGWFAYHLSPDGKTLYALVNGELPERYVRVYDAATGRALFAPPGHTAQASSVAFSPDQAHLRYIAARAAALAVAGQGQDEPPPGDAANAKLRGHALDWLKAELTVWQELFESGPAEERPAILQTLMYWHQDTSLAGIRDATALAKLPADKQKQWQALWARVPELRTVVPTSKEQRQKWRYTTQQPAEGWQRADFDDKEWKQGTGGFVRTEGNTADIWLRREFTMLPGTWDDLLLLLAHDDDVEVYINGVQALKAPGYSYYQQSLLNPETRKALKPGKNVFAVHCRIAGPQHFDVGMVAVKGNAARLALGRIAFDRKRFGLATQLWAAALVSDPKLGERQAGLRFSAARAAALAAAGQGNDELPPDDAAKAKLRVQALDWLRAELTAWTTAVEPDNVEALTRWRKESDLAGIRDRAALAKLPAEEQKAFTLLWADVAALQSKKAEEKLTQHPDDLATVEALTGILLEKVEPEWTTLKPLTVRSGSGATMTVLDDRSILVSGLNPLKDTYTFVAHTNLSKIRAIRLEALAHESLAKSGPGRSPWGNFALSGFSVTAEPLSRTGVAGTLKLINPRADFEQDRYPVAAALLGNPGTAWSIDPQTGKDHTAIVEIDPSQQAGFEGGTKLTFTLNFQFNNNHALGRFRLSVSSDPATFAREEKRLAVLKLTDPHARLGAAYLALDDARRAATFLKKATTANPNSSAADWLVLAVAHARLKETEQARKVCSKVAELLKSSDADALRPLLRELLLTLGPTSPESTALFAAAAGKPPAALNEAIQQNPSKAEGYRNRANWFIDHGLWKEAIADLVEVFRLEPDTYNGMRLGILLLYTGEIDRYRTHCQTMLKRWAATEINNEADQTLKTFLLLPDVKGDAKQLARLAGVAVSGNKNVDWFEWFMVARGLHDYRTGKYADALATCRESRRRAPKSRGDAQALASIDLAIEAMALDRSGDEAGAKRTLAEAKSIVEANVPGIDGSGWTHDLLTAHLLYREAEGLIAATKTKMPK